VMFVFFLEGGYLFEYLSIFLVGFLVFFHHFCELCVEVAMEFFKAFCVGVHGSIKFIYTL
jgi:hypothetical protein